MDSLSIEQAEISTPRILIVKRKQIKADNITDKVYPLPVEFHLNRIIHFNSFWNNLFFKQICF